MGYYNSPNMQVQDKNEIKSNFQKGLYAGIAELLLLGVVSRAKTRIYGYQIAKLVKVENADMPFIKLGTLYPILRSLEENGLLDSHVDPSISGPPRRYYEITPQGLEILEQLTQTWRTTETFVDEILAGAIQGG
jgi:PadR family transcriptional regulator, regulatory protein PadR